MIETFMDKLRRKADFWIGRKETLAEHQSAVHLRRLHKILKLDLVLDVGGNVGQFATFIRKRVGYHGDMVTFEPIPDIANKLIRIADSDKKWEIVQKGVGDKRGSMQFNIMESSPLSSLLSPTTAETDILVSLNTVKEVISIDIVTLDQFIKASEFRGRRNILLKLDVQGYEERCLDGAIETLKHVSVIHIEMSVTPLYQGMPKYYSLMEKLDELGFSLSLVPSQPSFQFPELIDFDCIFIRRRIASAAPASITA
jgi:FkbM family methyltransferase